MPYVVLHVRVPVPGSNWGLEILKSTLRPEFFELRLSVDCGRARERALEDQLLTLRWKYFFHQEILRKSFRQKVHEEVAEIPKAFLFGFDKSQKVAGGQGKPRESILLSFLQRESTWKCSKKTWRRSDHEFEASSFFWALPGRFPCKKSQQNALPGFPSPSSNFLGLLKA